MSDPCSQVEDDSGAVSTVQDGGEGKPHVHVPPRLDPDLYQADVPDWSPPTAETLSLDNIAAQSRCVYSERFDNSPEVEVRNLLEPICPRGQRFWRSEQSQIPLESDVFALEYLASFDYDVDRALFNMYCELGKGKDAVMTGRTASIAERTASNVVFSDCKERVFRIAAQPVLGSFPASLHPDLFHRSSAAVGATGTPDDDLPVAITSTMDHSPQGLTGTVASFGNTNADRHAVFTAIICHPRQQQQTFLSLQTEQDHGEHLESNVDTTAATSSSLFNPVFVKKGTSKVGKKKDKGKEDSATVAVGETSGEQGATECSTADGAQRISKPRGATADKVELRRKWVGVAQRAQALLGPMALSGSSASTGKGARQGTLSEAQALLELAYSLPPHSSAMSSTGSSVINSSSAASMSSAAVAAASEEAYLLDNVNTLLGKLVKAVLAGRFLVSEIRDAIFSCSLDAVVLSHPSEVKNKGSSKKGHPESLIKGLRELLKELEGQPLIADREEVQLKSTITATESLLKSVRSILRECCCWEASLMGTNSRPMSAPAPQPISSQRGRSEAFSADQAKALLQQNVHLFMQDGESFQQTPVAKRPTMAEVSELLRLAAINPVKISELPYITDVYRQGLEHTDMAATILVRAAQLAEARSRLTLDRVRYSLPDVHDLLATMHRFPFRSEEVDALQALVAKAEAWRTEVININGGSLTAATNSSGPGEMPSATSRSSRKSDSASHTKPVPLKKVESLLAEGERLPFELKVELDILKEKRQQAKLWLDKLKKSFVPTKTGSVRNKKSSDESGTVAEKLSLEEMRIMVSEGASLYQNPDSEDVEGAASLVGRTGGVVSCRTANRELDRAQAVVENAEDWITRVRDLLCGGGDEEAGAEHIGGEVGHISPHTIPGVNGSSESDGSGEEDDVDDPESTIRLLRAMLDEADGMPVALEECGHVRAHLQALEWSVKVRPLLAAESECSDGANNDKQTRKGRSGGLPRLSEMQQYAKEITKIRSGMSSSAGGDFPLKPLPEEAACLDLVNEAEKWLAKVKKAVQGSAVRKGTRLARVQQLCEEGSGMRIHFETELRPLRAALAAAEQWQLDNAAVLKGLGLLECEEDKMAIDPVSAVNPVDEDSSNNIHPASGGDVAALATSTGMQQSVPERICVPYEDLVAVASSASELLTDFEPSRRVQELFAEVNNWIQKVSSLCSDSPDSAATTTGAVKMELELGDEGDGLDASRTNKRRKITPQDSALPSGDFETEMDASPVVSLSSAMKNVPKQMVSASQLDHLVQQGRTFGLNLEGHVDRLLLLKARAEAWEREAMLYISSHFSDAFKRAFVEYKRLISDYTASDNGALFSFIPNRKPSALTPGNQAKAIREESTAHSKVTSLLDEVLEVRAQAEIIGVETPFFHAILVFIRLLEWVIEARNATCYQLCGRRRASTATGTGKNSKKTSCEGWEDLLEPVKHKNWGDFEEDLVMQLIREGKIILNHFYALESDDKFPGIEAHYTKGLLAPAATFQDDENIDNDDHEEDEEDGDDNDDRSEEGEGEDGGEERSVASDDEGEGDKNVDQHTAGDDVGKKRRKSTNAASAAARKKRKQAKLSSPTAAAKATRGAHGISKKRVEEDFVNTTNMNQAGTVHIEEKTGKSKRPRGSISASARKGTGEGTEQADGPSESSEVVVEQPVPLDITKTNRRAGFVSFLASVGSQKLRLAPAMAYMLDLWIRTLKVFASRLRLAGAWVSEVKSLLHIIGASTSSTDGNGATSDSLLVTAGTSAKAHTGEEIEGLLETAATESIQSSYRNILEATVQESKTWLKRAADMRSNSSALLSMDELKSFIKAGDKVIYVHERNAVLLELRNELKRARQWKSRLEKSGFDDGTAPADLLTELADEARTIRVNLSEFTDSIVQVNKTYCLCRQAYHGCMVGCDTCEEWYHFQCVGMSQTQAEKCVKYVCVRCSLKNSYVQSAANVAQITNKWMNCAEHFRKRDEMYQKASKKVFKEEKEVAKASLVLKGLLELAPNAAPAATLTPSAVETPCATASTISDQCVDDVADANGGTPVPVISTAAGSAPTAGSSDKLTTAQREVDQLRAQLAKTVADKEKLGSAIAIETRMHKDIFRWMHAMQELLWPSTDEQVMLGNPVGPTATAPVNSESVLEYNRTILSYLTSMLPLGLQHMERAAALVGIVSLEDVAAVLDAFRWMGWVNLCLHMLRNAPTTPALRRLLDGGKDIKCADEKILKLLNGVLQRAVTWKAKARKTMIVQQKKLDSTRLHTLQLEGNSLSFTSRIKEKLKEVMSGQPITLAPIDTPADASASSGGGKKRAPKGSADQANAAASAGASSSVAAGLSAEQWASRINASYVDECASSDEEDIVEQRSSGTASAAGLLGVPRQVPYNQSYYPINPQALASVPDLVWPPPLQVARRRPPVVAATAPAAAPAGNQVPATTTTTAPSNL